MPYILVLYFSQHGTTKEMAYVIAEAIERKGVHAKIRTVPKVSLQTEATDPSIPESGDLYCTIDELAQCSGLALGSPTYFGNMASSMKYFWDNTTSVWMNGALHGKPATVFCATGSMHGGQEMTLWSMFVPLLHHGCLIMGLNNSNPALSHTKSGGTPYGSSRSTGSQRRQKMSAEEHALCDAQGSAIADLVLKLAD